MEDMTPERDAATASSGREAGAVESRSDRAADTSPSPRPTYSAPSAIPYRDAARFLWGDDESGHVSDVIYASTSELHMIVFELPPGGRCLHSDTHRTVFGADVTYLVLSGRLVLANPENGEVRVAEPGELIFFRRDTWHHIFSHGVEQLRVLEFFAPPPSTGTSRKYAQTRPYLGEWRYGDDSMLGQWPPTPRDPTLHHRSPSEYVWRMDGDALVGIAVTTEHLTVASMSLMPGGKSTVHSHRGDECLYVTKGTLCVRAWGEERPAWLELKPGDGFYCPHGVEHEYRNIGSEPAEAVLGVAPDWRS